MTTKHDRVKLTFGVLSLASGVLMLLADNIFDYVIGTVYLLVGLDLLRTARTHRP